MCVATVLWFRWLIILLLHKYFGKLEKILHFALCPCKVSIYDRGHPMHAHIHTRCSHGAFCHVDLYYFFFFLIYFMSSFNNNSSYFAPLFLGAWKPQEV